MSDFYFQVLGANSALPATGRFPSSFILGCHNCLYLIDCGEGTQIKMSEYGIKRSRIGHIFISHMHGDHVLGLPGLLNSFSLNGRKEGLTIIGPVGIRKYLEGVLSSTYSHLTYKINYNELEFNGHSDLGKIDQLHVTAYSLDHRIPTYGFRFTEIIEGYNINSLAIKEYNLTIEEIKLAKQGNDIIRETGTIPNSKLTLPQPEPRSFSYCSDTAYAPSIVPHIQGSSLIYHEATYLKDKKEVARERKHSTAKEAATIANMAEVNQLVIGHYSSRYKDLNPLLEEARQVFSRTELAEEGRIYTIL